MSIHQSGGGQCWKATGYGMDWTGDDGTAVACHTNHHSLEADTNPAHQNHRVKLQLANGPINIPEVGVILGDKEVIEVKWTQVEQLIYDLRLASVSLSSLNRGLCPVFRD
ncbi:hypothetical protein K1T71_004854 [Dendrolimus kikuchii]|uniref:Uncharacterized protein n=1 Tax=Dendrolimus kikuchii TaxID=765133 RepID=A0ACC1D6I2_9NEOP|nr:hypothetical protein K1T71_004854 [Dendrolimus kikuchii]